MQLVSVFKTALLHQKRQMESVSKSASEWGGIGNCIQSVCENMSNYDKLVKMINLVNLNLDILNPCHTVELPAKPFLQLIIKN